MSILVNFLLLLSMAAMAAWFNSRSNAITELLVVLGLPVQVLLYSYCWQVVLVLVPVHLCLRAASWTIELIQLKTSQVDALMALDALSSSDEL